MMEKPENKINWKESNLALFGSALEKKIKSASAEKEHAWDGLGNSVTLQIWRIEMFLVKPWPLRKYGKVRI
jgi:gelsolin